MNDSDKNKRLGEIFGPRFVSIVVLCHGISIILFSFVFELAFHRHTSASTISLFITLGIGLTLIYLSALLGRRKRTALIATAVAYAIYLLTSLEGLSDIVADSHRHLLTYLLRAILLPIVILLLLLFNRHKFVVRSDSQGFQTAIGLSFIILAVTLVYGTIGFYFLGQSGFHQKLSIPAAMHYTVDQLNITTNHPVQPYTNRAKLFDDTLSYISIFAVIYVLVSFFQPIRSRFVDQKSAREKFIELLNDQHDAVSEDFFKIFPHDKQYFFDSTGRSGLAFHVYRGVPLIIGGPAGKSARFRQLLSEFQYVCWGNDWRPAIIHADGSLKEVYGELGFTMQKLGEEAVLDLYEFTTTTIKDKYFRNIASRFKKQDYSFELLKAPHHQAVINRLKEVSDQWLSHDNHVERGYVMGYFTEQYMAECDIAVAKDAAGTIQAFLNIVPAEFDKEEATYDLLRSSNKALGNINDYLLMNLCQSLLENGYKSLNLGLCPLVGIEGEDSKGIVGGVLSFAYANGDRFYSFSGLYRFKNKYNPNWQDRFIVYKGGVRGFSRTMNALMRTMSSTANNHLGRKG